MIFTFDETTKREILEVFGFDVSEDGYIVEQGNPTQKLLSPNGDPVRFQKFAGIQHGSLRFFESDLPSLIDVADRLK